jgi:hypothetical protein
VLARANIRQCCSQPDSLFWPVVGEWLTGSSLYTQAESLVVVNGVYHTCLNVPPEVWDGSVRWLGVSVNSGAELSPRTKIGSVPYTIHSATTDHATIADALTNPFPSRSAGVLAASYELDELGGTLFADNSGLGNTANAPVGGIAVGSSGHSGHSVNFSGGVITVSSGNSIPDSPQIWVETWIQPQSLSGTRTIMSKTGAYSLKQINDLISFSVIGAGGSCTVTSSTAVVAGNWFHASGWYNGVQIGVSVNGQKTIATCTIGVISSTLGQSFDIGGIYPSLSEAYAGRIDEVRVRTVAPF